MTAPRRPPGRYDAPRVRPAGRLLVVLGGALGLAALVGAYVLFARYTAARPTAAVQGFTVVSDAQVEVRFEVRKPAAATAYCVVRARDAGGAEVGTTAVRVGPARTATVAVTYRLATRGRANTGEVDGCSLRP